METMFMQKSVFYTFAVTKVVSKHNKFCAVRNNLPAAAISFYERYPPEHCP